MAFLSSSFLLLKTCPHPLHAKPTANVNTEATEKPMHKKQKSSSASVPDKPAGKTAAPLNRSAESCAPNVDLETSALTADQMQAPVVSDNPETSAIASRRTETRPVKQLTLRRFVREGWSLLEPVSKLCWTWHLDLICDYL